MDIELLRTNFGRMGARVHITNVTGRNQRGTGIDIRADKTGEYFDIRLRADDSVDYEVVDLRPEHAAPAAPGAPREQQGEISLRPR